MCFTRRRRPWQIVLSLVNDLHGLLHREMITDHHVLRPKIQGCSPTPPPPRWFTEIELGFWTRSTILSSIVVGPVLCTYRTLFIIILLLYKYVRGTTMIIIIVRHSGSYENRPRNIKKKKFKKTSSLSYFFFLSNFGLEH